MGSVPHIRLSNPWGLHWEDESPKSQKALKTNEGKPEDCREQRFYSFRVCTHSLLHDKSNKELGHMWKTYFLILKGLPERQMPIGTLWQHRNWWVPFLLSSISAISACPHHTFCCSPSSVQHSESSEHERPTEGTYIEHWAMVAGWGGVLLNPKGLKQLAV